MIPNCTCHYCPPYVGIPNAEAAKIIDVPPRVVPLRFQVGRFYRNASGPVSGCPNPACTKAVTPEMLATGIRDICPDCGVGTLNPFAPKTEDLTTVEALAALADGKRVRQTYPSQGSIWWLNDGFYRSSAGHCSENLTVTAHDLMHGRYRLEP